jgi:hypothetical protein
MYTWEPLTILSENLVIIISENPISNMFFCNFIENLPENLTFSKRGTTVSGLWME